jgi:hypothetical protein
MKEGEFRSIPFHALIAGVIVFFFPATPASFASLKSLEKPKIPIALSKRSLPNGCLIDSIAFKDSLEADTRLKNRWSKVLILGWSEKSKIKAHALCVFEFNGTIWAYDPASGTMPLTKDLRLKSHSDRLATLWLSNHSAKLIWSEFP